MKKKYALIAFLALVLASCQAPIWNLGGKGNLDMELHFQLSPSRSRAIGRYVSPMADTMTLELYAGQALSQRRDVVLSSSVREQGFVSLLLEDISPGDDYSLVAYASIEDTRLVEASAPVSIQAEETTELNLLLMPSTDLITVVQDGEALGTLTPDSAIFLEFTASASTDEFDWIPPGGLDWDLVDSTGSAVSTVVEDSEGFSGMEVGTYWLHLANKGTTDIDYAFRTPDYVPPNYESITIDYTHGAASSYALSATTPVWIGINPEPYTLEGDFTDTQNPILSSSRVFYWRRLEANGSFTIGPEDWDPGFAFTQYRILLIHDLDNNFNATVFDANLGTSFFDGEGLSADTAAGVVAEEDRIGFFTGAIGQDGFAEWGEASITALTDLPTDAVAEDYPLTLGILDQYAFDTGTSVAVNDLGLSDPVPPIYESITIEYTHGVDSSYVLGTDSPIWIGINPEPYTLEGDFTDPGAPIFSAQRNIYWQEVTANGSFVVDPDVWDPGFGFTRYRVLVIHDMDNNFDSAVFNSNQATGFFDEDALVGDSPAGLDPLIDRVGFFTGEVDPDGLNQWGDPEFTTHTDIPANPAQGDYPLTLNLSGTFAFSTGTTISIDDVDFPDPVPPNYEPITINYTHSTYTGFPVDSNTPVWIGINPAPYVFEGDFTNPQVPVYTAERNFYWYQFTAEGSFTLDTDVWDPGFAFTQYRILVLHDLNNDFNPVLFNTGTGFPLVYDPTDPQTPDAGTDEQVDRIGFFNEVFDMDGLREWGQPHIAMNTDVIGTEPLPEDFPLTGNLEPGYGFSTGLTITVTDDELFNPNPAEPNDSAEAASNLEFYDGMSSSGDYRDFLDENDVDWLVFTPLEDEDYLVAIGPYEIQPGYSDNWMDYSLEFTPSINFYIGSPGDLSPYTPTITTLDSVTFYSLGTLLDGQSIYIEITTSSPGESREYKVWAHYDHPSADALEPDDTTPTDIADLLGRDIWHSLSLTPNDVDSFTFTTPWGPTEPLDPPDLNRPPGSNFGFGFSLYAETRPTPGSLLLDDFSLIAEGFHAPGMVFEPIIDAAHYTHSGLTLLNWDLVDSGSYGMVWPVQWEVYINRNGTQIMQTGEYDIRFYYGPDMVEEGAGGSGNNTTADATYLFETGFLDLSGQDLLFTIHEEADVDFYQLNNVQAESTNFITVTPLSEDPVQISAEVVDDAGNPIGTVTDLGGGVLELEFSTGSGGNFFLSVEAAVPGETGAYTINTNMDAGI